MPQAEYIGVKDIEGPFILIENVTGVGYGELVDIRQFDNLVFIMTQIKGGLPKEFVRLNVHGFDVQLESLVF